MICNKKLGLKPDISKRLCRSCCSGIYPVLYTIRKDKHVEIKVLFSYQNTAREILKLYKFNNQVNLSQSISVLLLEHLDLSFVPDVIVPVPSHLLDELKRGYSHMILIAQQISSKTGIEFKNALSRKILPVFKRNQKTKKRSQRLKARIRYYIKSKYSACIAGKKILLIDDIYTTGATVNECARVLLDAGAKKVFVCCFALSPM